MRTRDLSCRSGIAPRLPIACFVWQSSERWATAWARPVASEQSAVTTSKERPAGFSRCIDTPRGCGGVIRWSGSCERSGPPSLRPLTRRMRQSHDFIDDRIAIEYQNARGTPRRKLLRIRRAYHSGGRGALDAPRAVGVGGAAYLVRALALAPDLRHDEHHLASATRGERRPCERL